MMTMLGDEAAGCGAGQVGVCGLHGAERAGAEAAAAAAAGGREGEAAAAALAAGGLAPPRRAQRAVGAAAAAQPGRGKEWLKKRQNGGGEFPGSSRAATRDVPSGGARHGAGSFPRAVLARSAWAAPLARRAGRQAAGASGAAMAAAAFAQGCRRAGNRLTCPRLSRSPAALGQRPLPAGITPAPAPQPRPPRRWPCPR